MPATDIRALGRLGETLGAASPQGRHRRFQSRRHGDGSVARRSRVPRPVMLAAAFTVLAVLWLGATASGQTGTDTDSAALAAVPARPAGDVSRGQARTGAAAFAVVDGLELVLPHPAPALIGYHEASRAEALPLAPLGEMLANDNPTKFEPPSVDPSVDARADVDGPSYHILSSRGRARPATSAVDIAVPDGAFVAAPVTGKVVEVRQYDLTGSVRDWRVVIAPADAPDLHVVLIHLHQPGVAVGDQVVAGETPLAVARMLPFDSHIDYVIGQRQPHTHIEVKPAVAPGPLDPNAPALAPTDQP